MYSEFIHTSKNFEGGLPRENHYFPKKGCLTTVWAFDGTFYFWIVIRLGWRGPRCGCPCRPACARIIQPSSPRGTTSTAAALFPGIASAGRGLSKQLSNTRLGLSWPVSYTVLGPKLVCFLQQAWSQQVCFSQQAWSQQVCSRQVCFSQQVWCGQACSWKEAWSQQVYFSQQAWSDHTANTVWFINSGKSFSIESIPICNFMFLNRIMNF